jgi:hypothetical protein
MSWALQVSLAFLLASQAKNSEPSSPERLVFVNSARYKGCVDTEIWELSPHKVMQDFDVVTSDANNDGGESQILMRFDGIFGKELGQVPKGSRIRKATLIVTAFDPGTTVNLHRMLVPWSKAATWNNLVAGVSADGQEASRHKESFTFGKITANKQTVRFEVTDSVQAWSSGKPNYGWVFLNTGGNGWDFYSSEYQEEDSRPGLEVEFFRPSVTSPTAKK